MYANSERCYLLLYMGFFFRIINYIFTSIMNLSYIIEEKNVYPFLKNKKRKEKKSSLHFPFVKFIFFNFYDPEYSCF